MDELKNLLSMLKTAGVAGASFYEDGTLQGVQFFPSPSDDGLSTENIDLGSAELPPNEATERLLNRERGSYRKDSDK